MAKIFIDACMPRSTAATIVAAGHFPIDARDVGLREAGDPIIADFARTESAAVVTLDFDFADERNYPPDQYFGLIVLQTPADFTATQICELLASFLSHRPYVELIAGRLAIVSPGRVRFRPRP